MQKMNEKLRESAQDQQFVSNTTLPYSNNNSSAAVKVIPLESSIETANFESVKRKKSDALLSANQSYNSALLDPSVFDLSNTFVDQSVSQIESATSPKASFDHGEIKDFDSPNLLAEKSIDLNFDPQVILRQYDDKQKF